MTQAEAEFIRDAMDAMGHHCEIQEGYSGRGMYDKETYAITTDDITAMIPAVAMFVADGNDPPSEFECSDGYREDSMGRGVVIY